MFWCRTSRFWKSDRVNRQSTLRVRSSTHRANWSPPVWWMHTPIWCSAAGAKMNLPLNWHGVPYLDILAQGGGILSTVRSTRAASEDELFDKTAKDWTPCSRWALPPVKQKAATGWTLKECKQLNVTRRLNQSQPVELVSTFMAAHALPEEYQKRPRGLSVACHRPDAPLCCRASACRILRRVL